MEEEEEPLNGEQTAKWVAGGPGDVDRGKAEQEPAGKAKERGEQPRTPPKDWEASRRQLRNRDGAVVRLLLGTNPCFLVWLARAEACMRPPGSACS